MPSLRRLLRRRRRRRRRRRPREAKRAPHSHRFGTSRSLPLLRRLLTAASTLLPSSVLWPPPAGRAPGHPNMARPTLIWRAQVEHPVTEGITGCNVPSLQLMVAMGCDLTKLTPDVGIA
eukprot:5702872-Prymnesium_polylepis.1